MIGSISQVDGVVTPEFKNRMRTQMQNRFPVPVNYGTVPNSVAAMWADMNEPHIGVACNLPSNYGQFGGPWQSTLFNIMGWDNLNLWLELEEEGDGSGCSPTINQSTNTRVEVGTMRMYWKRNNTWSLVSSIKKAGGPNMGGKYPLTYFGPDEGGWNRMCGLDGRYHGHPHGNYVMERDEGEFLSVNPKYYYVWHSWLPRVFTTNPYEIQGVYGVVHLRLIVADPSKPDDRNLARYVAHVGSDRKKGHTTPISDIGISRYKRVTSEWQAFNFYSFPTIPASLAELEANPPPIINEP